ncbi:MAG TPA: formate dehydrogenase accessory sulfurtransferase FdhD [Caulobacter sp.]|nr:formate dehydrogenase accessory sulfurtransferase FdhD [Caulobacter sp.]
MSELPPVTETRPARQWRSAGGTETAITRPLADEAAVGILYDGRPHAVLMATPADVEDLAVGFTLSERIATADQIAGVAVEALPEGVQVDVRLSPAARATKAKARARTLEGRSSCGLCGVQRLAAAVRPLQPVRSVPPIGRAAIAAALEALEEAQDLGRLTRACHAAALADAEGRLLLVREDVGRHNALDKLIGAAARAGTLAPLCLVTSRCSYEMVEKAAIAGFPVLVAISAPTALALRKAQEADLTLIALARADGFTVFTGEARITP